MEKIKFKNEQAPYINDINLNQMQDNIEKDKVSNSRTIAGIDLVDDITSIELANALKSAMGDLMYPVGSIYISTKNTNPSSLFGGTWIAFGSGRTIVGVDTSQTEFNEVEKTGGEKTHTLTVKEMPSHIHDFNYGERLVAQKGSDYAVPDYANLIGKKITTSSVGGGQAHNNLQPYITCYMWKRTA